MLTSSRRLQFLVPILAAWSSSAADPIDDFVPAEIKRQRIPGAAIAISERTGLYRDYPVSKGCTTPFAAVCIPEMVSKGQRL